MRTYRTHFGVPIGSQTGWRDNLRRATKPTLPSYLQQNIPYHLSCALSRLRLFGHSLNIVRLQQQQNRVFMSLEFALNANGTVCKMKSMSSY